MEWIIILYFGGVALLGVFFIIHCEEYTFAESTFITVFYPLIILVWGTFIILLLAITLLVALIGAVDVILKGIGNRD